MKKVHKSSGTDDKKLQTSLKKLNVQPIQAIEEVNMFKEDGNVIHFAAPKGIFFFDFHRPRKTPHCATTLTHRTPQSTPPSPLTPSPSMATAKIKS